MRVLIAAFLAMSLSFAAAWSFPGDAGVFVTDGEGTIVGVGRTVAGEAFELQLLVGFDGFAQLTFVTLDGEVVVLELVVVEGVAYVDFVDLRVLAARAGFGDVRVAPAEALVADGDADPRSLAGMGNASETGRERAGEHPDERAYLGSGNAEREIGPPAEPPVGPPHPPPGPPDPPVDPPAGPPVDPDDPPAGPPADVPGPP